MKFELGEYLHTYTIIGRCPKTLQFGVALATYSLAVGSYCPFVKANIGAISSQAYAEPKLGAFGMKLLEMGYTPDRILNELKAQDEFFEYRQVGIVDKEGVARCHTGDRNRGWAGHIVGDGFVAMGNALMGEHIVEAIAASYKESNGKNLDERLLLALEAGHEAGGQCDADGTTYLTERSSALVIHHQDEYPVMDIRVDAHETAVEELRRIHKFYAPYLEYMDVRAKNPAVLPSQNEWAAQNGIEW